jgi:hypothetical protein
MVAFATSASNNRLERARRIFGKPRRDVDDVDKSASLFDNATPRRSTSSLEAALDTGIALVYRICYEQFGGQRFS